MSNNYAVFTIDVEKPYPDAEKGVYDYLKIFEKTGIKATFFVTGDVAIENPDIVRAIAKEGHEVASHGFDHPYIDKPVGQRTPFFTELTASDRRNYVQLSKKVLQDLGGDPKGFRAPWLRVNTTSLHDIANYFDYDSSLTGKTKNTVDLPADLKEIYITAIPGLGAPASTSLYLGRIPKFIFTSLLQLSRSEPLVIYGHSFDFIKCFTHLYTSWIKRWWYFSRCAPDNIKNVTDLIVFLQNHGIKFVPAYTVGSKTKGT